MGAGRVVTAGASIRSSAVRSQETGDVVFATDDFVVATWKNISIVIWGTRATPALVTEMDRALQPFDAMRSSGFSTIHFIAKNAQGTTVNRWISTGMLAASASSSETAFLTWKVARALGLLVFDNQARV